jgi:acyl-CoA thioesterase-2
MNDNARSRQRGSGLGTQLAGCTDASREEIASLGSYRRVGDDRFRVEPYPTGLSRLYGGQLTSQALGAAQLTVTAERLANSLHAYYGAPGLVDRPIDFIVLRDRDGRSFSSRRVVGEQDGKILVTLAASFQVDEPGARFQQPMPAELPDPETLPTLVEQTRALGDRLPERHRPWWLREDLIDWRPVEPLRFVDPLPEDARPSYWFRLRCTIGDDPAVHQRFLTYASDMHIFHAATAPLGVAFGSDMLQTSSLDHAVWFHDHKYRVDDWLLYTTGPIAAGGARGLGTGAIFTRDGRQIATAVQEGLVRLLSERRLRF